jgi:uncharacterized membrane protein
MGREISEAQRNWLTAELDAWRAQGVVSDDQVKTVLGLYASPGEVSDLRRSKALVTLVALAALMVGAGVLLLIGYNWQAMPSAAKLVVIFGAVVAAHSAGLWLRYRAGLREVSEAAFLLGSLLFGAGIWLIAQIFNINAHSADGFWWWALGVLPLALALETPVLHALLVALLAVWAGFEVFGSGPVAWLLFGWAPGLAHGAYSLLLLAAPGLVWAYRKGSDKVVALYVPLIAWWVILQPFAWQLEVNPVYFIGAVGGLLLLAAEAHRAGSLMAIPYRFFGTALVAGALVMLSYHDFNRRGGGFGDEPTWAAAVLACATLVLAAAAVVLVADVRRRSRPEPGPLTGELREVARRQWLPVGMIAVMVALGFWDALTDEAIVPTVVANLAMVVLALWLMQVGLHEDRGQPFAAGVLYFLLWTVLRYIDLFGSFGGMLGAALMFFLCGATLLGVALFWRKRKAVQLDPH